MGTGKVKSKTQGYYSRMDTFPVVILIGRPAAGKSEVIDYLKQVSDGERRERFHLAPLQEIDDFVWVWETFQDDDIRSKHGKPRLHTTVDYYFTDSFIWNFFIEKINHEFAKRLARDPDYQSHHTTLVEFARGGECGFRDAFAFLSDEILKHAVILYIRVSFEESLRRNRKRARKGQEDSILYHALPDKKMEYYYKTNDWDQISGGEKQGTIDIKGNRVPFAVFENEPEKTDDPAKLGPALEDAFTWLWNHSMKIPMEESTHA